MILYSTCNKREKVTFRDAVIKGIADDGGLYMPLNIPVLPESFFKNINKLSFKEISFRVVDALLEKEIPEEDLWEIIESCMNFRPEVRDLEDNSPKTNSLKVNSSNSRIYVMELFHGPTLAFKDFGARFMAGMLSYFNRGDWEEKTGNRGGNVAGWGNVDLAVGSRQNITVLVATSGDTGSAVANGFHNVPGVRVVLLYPSGRVSKIQEQQLTTLGGNITAVEVNGSFDDCQSLVKRAFADMELRSRVKLTSANSINIARLIPQSFYYHYAYSRIKLYSAVNQKRVPLIFSVPSGNLGNLTGGLIAMRMGLPVHKFIAAGNANDVLPDYLQSGRFTPKPSVRTISNAMDVGNPGNLSRIRELFGNDHKMIGSVVFSRSNSDSMTIRAIREVYEKHGYLLDPHGAVGYLAIQDYLEKYPGVYNTVLLETAHPAKFTETFKSATGVEVALPERLSACLAKEKKAVYMENSYEELKRRLVDEKSVI
ncbi:MAG: threonine synthase [Bacteroidales bacterium]|nr:threonine synthase [Bacteroidales bacterium]